MATKRTRSVGKDIYLIQAAKLCIYPVDIPGKFISVPENELGTDDLMVAHLVKEYGFKIQSAIPQNVTKTEIYNPSLTTPLFPDWNKQVTLPESIYNTGQKFKVVSDNCELKISYIQSGKIHLDYTNRNKPTLIISEEQLTKSIANSYWITLL